MEAAKRLVLVGRTSPWLRILRALAWGYAWSCPAGTSRFAASMGDYFICSMRAFIFERLFELYFDVHILFRH